jgi:hypothetical protein
MLVLFYFGNLLPKEGKMNFAEGLRGLGFSDADISFLHRDYALESMCKDMKIKPYRGNKSETKSFYYIFLRVGCAKIGKFKNSLIRLIISTLFVISLLCHRRSSSMSKQVVVYDNAVISVFGMKTTPLLDVNSNKSYQCHGYHCQKSCYFPYQDREHDEADK